MDLIFGVGMGGAWTDATEITFNKKSIRPRGTGKIGIGKERVLFIPAHRAIRRLRTTGARWQLVCDAFRIPDRGPLKKVAMAALKKETRVHFLAFHDGKARSKDISSLDPGDDDDDVSGWGGLTGFSSHVGEAVRRAANESERG